MLDKNKVKLMTKLALYEETQGKQDFKISEYYRTDYVGFHMLCTFLWTTVGYICAVALIMIAIMESLIANLTGMLIVALGGAIVVGYVVVVTIFLVIANRLYNGKHKQARYRVKKYNHDLIKLLRMYEREGK